MENKIIMEECRKDHIYYEDIGFFVEFNVKTCTIDFEVYCQDWSEPTKIYNDIGFNLFANVQIKWDGCSNWDFNCDPVLIHFCGREEAKKLGILVDKLYDLAKQHVLKYEED